VTCKHSLHSSEHTHGTPADGLQKQMKPIRAVAITLENPPDEVEYDPALLFAHDEAPAARS
jgi:hypothetical protein